MALGSEGPGGIEFDDPDLARTIGVIALVAILFEGGLTASWRDIRPVAVPAGILATAGVAITALVTGAAAYVLFDVPPAAALLLGAIVGSTDAAAVFSTLRFTRLRRRVAALLETESGANDPMAVALTIGLIEWLMTPGFGAADLTGLLVRQLGLGLVLGLGLGLVASRAFTRFPLQMAPFAPVASVSVASLAFGITQAAGGSGFLAVYVVGLWLGNTRTPLTRAIVSFHQGAAFLAQIVLFTVLGLLVFPSHLGPVVLSGLALAAVLTFVARPVAVWLCTAFQGFKLPERHFVSWVGLRGAVPIVLATFPLSAGVAASETIFNAVFFVVLVSALLQGLTLAPLARRLGLATESRPLHEPPIEVGAVRALGADILELEIDEDDDAAGRAVRDLGLPGSSVIALIVRNGEAVLPRGSTMIHPGDRLYVLGRSQDRRELESRLRGGA